MRKRRGGAPRYVSSDYHPKIIGGRDDDSNIPAKGLPTQDINVTSNGEADEKLLVASFDGSARINKKGSSFSAVIWRLPEWTIVDAKIRHAYDLTVNKVEYNGLILCFELLIYPDRRRVPLWYLHFGDPTDAR